MGGCGVVYDRVGSRKQRHSPTQPHSMSSNVCPLSNRSSVIIQGLRHLSYGTRGFSQAQGSITSTWQFYTEFATNEQKQSFPASAYKDILLPSLPGSHARVLSSITELVAVVATHATKNAMTGEYAGQHLMPEFVCSAIGAMGHALTLRMLLLQPPIFATFSAIGRLGASSGPTTASRRCMKTTSKLALRWNTSSWHTSAARQIYHKGWRNWSLTTLPQ